MIHVKIIADDDYVSQYSNDFTSRWDDLIDWDKRAEGEGGFFTDRLHEAGVRTLIDVSTGSGFHAVQMKRAGFEVCAADGSPTMVERARQNFRHYGLDLPLHHLDWRQLSPQRLGTFDAVLCLGSSLCHVFDALERQRILRRFHSLLKTGGLLIVDQRNFLAIRAGQYQASGNYYYCGKSVSVIIGEVTDQVCEFIYRFNDGSTYRLRVCPVLPETLGAEIAASGFNYQNHYGDFSLDYESMKADFIIHTARAAPSANGSQGSHSLQGNGS